MADLFVDKLSKEEKEHLSEERITYNLLEDIQCLKEENQRLKEKLGENNNEKL